MGHRLRSLISKFLGGAASLLLLAAPSQAVDEFADIKTISKLPATETEIKAAFRSSRGAACEIVPKGEPLEINSFTSVLTVQDRRIRTERLLVPSRRQSIFSVGLEFDADDRADLPALSRGSIVEYVDQNYVSIQGRVRRDLLDRKLYFHHRPIAVNVQYRGSKLSQPFEPIVSKTVTDFHGLGMLVPKGTRLLTPELLRTMVLVFRSPMLTGSTTTDQYEFVFVRGKEAAQGNVLESHVFCTTEDRSKLHYLNVQARPVSAKQTTILGRTVITRYDSSGLYPKSSATRSFRLSKQSEFGLDELDAYCAAQGLEGGFATNVEVVLDAIIARQPITPR